MDIVLLGAPGAGKGTQGELLAAWLGIPIVSSGQLFRDAMEASTPLGEQVRGYVNRGAYVPDELTIAMVAERLGRADCACGTILDGFPRTLAQAEALSGILAGLGRQVDVVAYIQVPVEKLVARLSGRMNCPNCGAVYHVLYNPPRSADVCDRCGATLTRRADDSPEVHERRIRTYLDQTMPLIAWYRDRGLLVEIDGDREIDAIQQSLRDAVRAARPAGGSAFAARGGA